MERKAGTGTVAVTKEDVKSALSKTRTLTSEEEKALRMRHGAAVESPKAPLPRAAGNNAELEDELLVIEMQLHKAWKMRFAQEKAKRNTVVAAPARPTTASTSKSKDKIVRALRKKQ